MVPEAPVMATIRRRVATRGQTGSDRLGLLEQFLQFAALKHFGHDVGAADELAVDIQLRNRRPIRVLLDALAYLLVLQNINGDQILHAARFQYLDRATRKATLGELLSALHEENDLVARDGLFDELLCVHL